MVAAETTSPVRAYSQKPIVTRGRARCTTIRFATDPKIVGLPARVDAIASTSHAWAGFRRCVTNGLNTSTAGTLLTRFDSSAVMTLSAAVFSSLSLDTKR